MNIIIVNLKWTLEYSALGPQATFNIIINIIIAKSSIDDKTPVFVSDFDGI